MPLRIKDKDYKDLYTTESGVYYIRYWSPRLRRELEYSLKTTNKTKAVRERKLIIDNLDKEKTRAGIKYRRMSEMIEAFLDETRWKSVNTKKSAMVQYHKHILPFFGEYNPDAVTNELWLNYSDQRREADPECSLHNVRKYLCKLMNWAFERRHTAAKFNPEDMDKLRSKIGVVVERRAFEEVLEHLNQDWRDIAELAWEMGLRVTEIKQLEWSRVNFETGELRFEARHTKTRKPKTPVITHKVREILLRRKESTTGSPWVFPGYNPKKHFSVSDQAWQLAKEKVNATFRFHDIRHTWLTNAFKRSNNYAQICAYAGCSLDEAIKTYVKFSVSDMAAVAASISTQQTGNE